MGRVHQKSSGEDSLLQLLLKTFMGGAKVGWRLVKEENTGCGGTRVGHGAKDVTASLKRTQSSSRCGVAFYE